MHWNGKAAGKGGKSENLPVRSDMLSVDKRAWSEAGFKVKTGHPGSIIH